VISDKLKIRVAISQIHTLRLKIQDLLAGEQYGRDTLFDITLVAELFQRMVRCFPPRLQDSELFITALHRSLENYLIGRVYSAKLAWLLISRLAGNVGTLASGHPLAPPASNTADQYWLAVVKNVYPSTKECPDEYVLVFEILTGPSAGIELESEIKNTGLLLRLMQVAGVMSRQDRRNEVKIHPRFLSGCYMFILPLESDRGVFIKDFGTSPAVKGRNRKLYVERTVSRRCPENYDWSCDMCPKGTETCSLATHPSDCVLGICPLCSDTSEFIDPDTPGSASFNCQYRMFY